MRIFSVYLLINLAMISTAPAQEGAKGEMDAYVELAKKAYGEGDYNQARDLCEEILKREPGRKEASDLAVRAVKQLERLFDDSVLHGDLLWSLNEVSPALQYWNRAANYTRPGNSNYEALQRRLEKAR